MIYKLGRFLQLLGLLVLPVGVAGNIARPEMVGVRATLAIAIAGIAVFAAGWGLQQLSR
jgi:hypothetical protein